MIGLWWDEAEIYLLIDSHVQLVNAFGLEGGANAVGGETERVKQKKIKKVKRYVTAKMHMRICIRQWYLSNS